jgi:putative Holliday junction resolvase
MKILGIDYGKKNIGLALYDTTVRVAIPFGIVSPAEIAAVVSSEHIDQIVIGLPLGLDGKENDATVRVRKLMDCLTFKQ